MKTKEDIVNDLKIIYPGLFKTFDWAIPTEWMKKIWGFSKSNNLAYIWVYHKTNGCQVRNGYPYPLDHFSSIILEKWSLCEEQRVADIYLQEGYYIWKDRDPKLLQYEDLIFSMVSSRQITDLEAMVMLELIDKFSSDTKSEIQRNKPYLTDAFSNLFEEEV